MSISFAERMRLAAAAKAAQAEQAPSETLSGNNPTQVIVDEASEEPAVSENIDWSKLSFKEKLAMKAKGFTPPSTPLPNLEEDKEPEPKVEEPLPRVIQLANEASKLAETSAITEGELLTKEVPDSVHILRRRISQLQDMDGLSLRTEMDDLRKLLLANPDACLYMLPEDTGLLVRALRKITDNKVAIDMGSTRTAKATAKTKVDTKLTAAEMQAAFDDL